MFMLMLVCNLLMTVLAEDFKDLNTTELLKLAIDISQIVPINPRSSDVQFYLLDDIETEPRLINSSSYGQVNLEKPMKMVIHGWLENHKR
ncbi:hypothetical protein GWI33_015975 [Rhynchophorus ferrugineus]|uniref:Uncharacterized protein n=1 Tax=Rhynchophorus ferrugineus TaxID=354439 RepID=A0A834HYT1_RHYFE|nr:hypothetical protein GWI33_015975 [Rhynchophorus ferrugineus]